MYSDPRRESIYNNVLDSWSKILQQWSLSGKAPNGSYICPICGGIGTLAMSPESKSNRPILECSSCFYKGDIVALYQQATGTKSFNTTVQTLANMIGADGSVFDKMISPKKQPTKKPTPKIKPIKIEKPKIEQQYSIDALCKLSGFTYNTIYRCIQDGKIKAHKINGKYIRISASEVEKFLNGTPFPTSAKAMI